MNRGSMKNQILKQLGLSFMVLILAGAAERAWAVDFHVTTAQEFQNTLTIAAANGASDVIYLTNGFYSGNFNFSTGETNSLTLQAESGVSNNLVLLDGAGIGRAVNLSSSTNTPFTVRGLTFLRNCGDTAKASLRVATGTGTGADILAEDCQFISPANTKGIGFEIISAKSAVVRRCNITGTNGYDRGGCGVSISSLSGTGRIESCFFAKNNNSGLSIVNASGITIASNTFSGNWSANGAGVNCSATTILLAGNTFFKNSAYSQNSRGGGANLSGTVTLIANLFQSNSLSGPCDYCGISGGGVYIAGGSTISNNIFIGNIVSYIGNWGGGYGGAISCAGSASITDNTFTGNSAQGGSEGTGVGGAIYQNVGSSVILRNTFNGNSAGGGNSYAGKPRGGGAYFSGILSANTFSGNSAQEGGGAYSPGGGTISDNNFTGNSGGGLVIMSGAMNYVLHNMFKNNQGTGLIAIGDNFQIQNNLLSGNASGVNITPSSKLDMVNNTISGNSGGGLTITVSGVTEILHIYNNIIWGNGADVYLAGTGSRKEFLFNNAHSMSGVWDIAQNNLDVSPQFFDPINGDYHIQNTSPCKEAGTNGAPTLPATDLDGGARIAYGTVDLGCYEFNTAVTHPADTNNNFVITAAEFSSYATAWKQGQAWTNAPNPITADYVTRAGYLITNGGTYHNDGSARPVNWKVGP